MSTASAGKPGTGLYATQMQASFPFGLAVLMPLGLVGIAGSLQYPVLLVLSALALCASFGVIGVKLLRTPSASVSAVGPV